MIRVVLISVFLLGLSGCGTIDIPEGVKAQPIAYQDGFKDGCKTGEYAVRIANRIFVKNINRFNSDKLYAEGWNDGYQTCLPPGMKSH